MSVEDYLSTTPGYLTREQWESQEHTRTNALKQEIQETKERRDRQLYAQEYIYEGEIETAQGDSDMEYQAHVNYTGYTAHYRQKYGQRIEQLEQAREARIKTMTEMYDRLEELEAAVQEQKDAIAQQLGLLQYQPEQESGQ